ncbi:MAG TPA: response regulator [Smithellaceae bacterium]|nr:response regulator [Smithellaceae bacterium]HQM44247.1 response regulator [Smithellaceae bacterium]
MKTDDKPLINLKMKRVLVVDDFFNFRLTIKNMLRSFGIMYIDDAASGEEAVRKLALRRFDIVLCDYNLGSGKSGQQVLEEGKFRGYIGYSSIFIMITAENTAEMIMSAMEYQPDSYIMKPFAKEVLEKRIKNIAAKKENIRDVERAILNKDFDSALRICDELLATNPGNLSEIMSLKGEVLLKKADYPRAADFYDKIMRMGNVGWAQLGRGRVELLRGNYERAKDIFEYIISHNNKLMPAYDYLAETLLKLNNAQEAQQILMKAVNISPRALLRQKNLGNIAYRNEDFKTAETSFKAAVEQGKNSCYKNSSDYTSLAKTLVHCDNAEEGLKVLGSATKEFPNDNDAQLHLSVAESFVYTKMNKIDEAKRSLTDAQKLAENMQGDIPSHLALDLAQAYFLTGNEEKGEAIIKNIVSSNHDNEKALDDVRMIFRDMGMTDKGDALIKTTRDEIIRLNNEGVKLAQEGRLTEAIAYFEKAAGQLPDNKIINANAAQVLMLYMRETGVNNEYLARAKSYLDKVRKIDENYADLAALLVMYRDLCTEEQYG